MSLKARFVPGSPYQARHHATHLAVLRAARRMTPADFLASLRDAGVDPDALAHALRAKPRRGSP